MIRAIFIPQLTRLGECRRRFRFVQVSGKYVGTVLAVPVRLGPVSVVAEGLWCVCVRM
jgi:hypothetical protein